MSLFCFLSWCNGSWYTIYSDLIMAMKITDLRALALCSLVETYQRFGGTCCYPIFFYTVDSNIPTCTPKGNSLWFKCRRRQVSHLSMNRVLRLWTACCCRPATEAAVSRSIRRAFRSKLWAVTPRRPLGTDRTRRVTVGPLVCSTEAEERIALDGVNDDTRNFPKFSYYCIPVPILSGFRRQSKTLCTPLKPQKGAQPIDMPCFFFGLLDFLESTL
jgi:hypothetical protein